MQGCLNCRNHNNGEKYIYVDNSKKIKVEVIGKFRCLLKNEFYLDLDETFVVPSFRHNLISVFALDKHDYSCSFENIKFSLFYDSKLVSSSTFSSNDNLYLLDTITSFYESLQLSTQGLKRKLTNENSVVLWYRRLGHIFRQMITL